MSHSNTSNEILASVLSHSLLDLHILPTEKCNFRCVYCYEDFMIGKMKPNVVNGIKKLITKRMSELKQLRLSWFGGEPLAAADIVLDISNYAKSEAEKNACHFNFGMTTNGYLLDIDRFNLIVSAGITSFQISLDGPPNEHDKTRRRADGSGTFKRIWHNLCQMANTVHQFEVILRIHITPENVQHIPILLEMIKYQFKEDKRFKVFLKTIVNLGGPNAGTFDVLTGKTKDEVLTHLNSILGDEFIKHEINKKDKPYVCYASSQNAWVIRANGSLAKCTVLFNDDRNKVGHLNDDGTFYLEQDKINLWLRGLKNLDVSIIGCPAYQLPPLKPSKLNSIPLVVK